MDPRKAARVTTPDLVSAFEEGSGGAGKRDDTQCELLVFLLLGHNDVGPMESHIFKLVEMDEALDMMRVHLEHGYKYTAAVGVDIKPPKWFAEREHTSVSQLEH